MNAFAFLSTATLREVKHHAAYLNPAQLDRLENGLTYLADIITAGIDIRYPDTAPKGSWFFREGSSAAKVALDRMIYVQMLRLRDRAADTVALGTVHPEEELHDEIATLQYLYARLVEHTDSTSAEASLKRTLISAAKVKEASEQDQNLIFGLLVSWISDELVNTQVKLYESCVNSPIKAIEGERDRYIVLAKWFDSLNAFQTARIDASKRGAQVTVAEAKLLCQLNIAELNRAIAHGLCVEDPVKERTTDVIVGTRAATEGTDDDARRAASDQKMTNDLAAEFGGVFRNWDEHQTVPNMH